MIGRLLLHQFALIEETDMVTDMANDAEIMADEKIGHFQPFLQIIEQIQNLRLHGNIKG